MRNACLLLVLILNTIQAQENHLSGNFLLDPRNTQIEFSAKHFGVLKVEGTFKEFSGHLKLVDGALTSGSLEIVVSSVTTGNRSRDNSLKSEDFLDANSFPLIHLRFDKNSDKAVVWVPTLIKGMKHKIKLNYDMLRENQLKATCTISRKDFQLDFGTMDDLVSDEIRVKAVISLKRKNP